MSASTPFQELDDALRPEYRRARRSLASPFEAMPPGRAVQALEDQLSEILDGLPGSAHLRVMLDERPPNLSETERRDQLLDVAARLAVLRERGLLAGEERR